MTGKKPQKHRARRQPPPRKPGTLGLERAENLVTQLHGRLKARGHGKIRETEEKLKYTRGYLSQVKSLGDIKLSVLYELADELGVSLGELFSDDSAEPEVRPVGPKPAIVALVLTADGPGVPDSKIDFLDEFRFQSPSQTLNLIASLDEISKPQISQILGIVASCYFQIYNLDAALWSIDLALSTSKSADLYLRKAYIFSEMGSYASSKRFVEIAQSQAIEDFDLASLGESLGSLAFLRYKSGKFFEARDLYFKALNYQNYLPPRKLCSLHQGVGFVLTAENNKNEANKHFELALSLAQKTDNHEYIAKTAWTMAFNQETIEDSKRLLEQAISWFPPHCAIDRSLAIIDLADVYLDTGLKGKACRCIRQAFDQLEYLSFVPEVEYAMANLIESAASQLEKAILIESRKKIVEARARLITRGAPKMGLA